MVGNQNIKIVNARLSSFVDKLQDSPGQVIEKTGISRTTFYAMQKPGGTIKHENLTALINVYKLDLNWLFDNPNFQIVLDDRSESRMHLVNEPEFVPQDESEFYKIPFYPNVKASAGGGLIPDESKPPLRVAFRKFYITQTLRAQAKNLIVINATGDSMQDVIHDGDSLMIDTSRKTPGGIMIIRIDENVNCKYLQELPGGRYRVMSKNPAYESFEISANEKGFDIIGQVVWRAETLIK